MPVEVVVAVVLASLANGREHDRGKLAFVLCLKKSEKDENAAALFKGICLRCFLLDIIGVVGGHHPPTHR